MIVGGWGGGVIGLSSLDDMDASENETTTYQRFEDDKWYKLRLKVDGEWIRAWIDNEEHIAVNIKGRRLGLRGGEIDLSIPFGIATWSTTSALRNIKLKEFKKQDGKPDSEK